MRVILFEDSPEELETITHFLGSELRRSEIQAKIETPGPDWWQSVKGLADEFDGIDNRTKHQVWLVDLRIDAHVDGRDQLSGFLLEAGKADSRLTDLVRDAQAHYDPKEWENIKVGLAVALFGRSRGIPVRIMTKHRKQDSASLRLLRYVVHFDERSVEPFDFKKGDLIGTTVLLGLDTNAKREYERVANWVATAGGMPVKRGATSGKALAKLRRQGLLLANFLGVALCLLQGPERTVEQWSALVGIYVALAGAIELAFSLATHRQG